MLFRSGLMLLGAKIHWLCPDGPWFIFKSEQVNQKVEQHPEITGIVLSNPSYEGHISDISAVAELCKSKGIKLVIDESLGSHWVGNNLFPQTSIHHADMVFHSLHKRVGALVPSALMHIPKMSAIDPLRVSQYVRMFRSTSPSNIVLASTEFAIANCLCEDDYAMHTHNLIFLSREITSTIEADQNPSINDIPIEIKDPFTLHFLPLQKNPCQVAERLYDLGIDYEYADDRGVILFFSKYEKEESLPLLKDTISKVISECPMTPTHIFTYPEPIMNISPTEAMDSIHEEIYIEENAIGRVSGEIITDCPPGIPLLIPGEHIQNSHLMRLRGRPVSVVRLTL